MGAQNKIVIVDDDQSLVWILGEILSLAGIEHISATSGPAGLRLIGEEKPALAIVDVKMGAVSGLDVARGVPALSPGTRILFLTGYASSARDRIEPGMPVIGVMEKPFKAVELLDIVREALAGSPT